MMPGPMHALHMHNSHWTKFTFGIGGATRAAALTFASSEFGTLTSRGILQAEHF